MARREAVALFLSGVAWSCGPTEPDAAAQLEGRWREVAQFGCGSGAQVVPTSPIGELDFRKRDLFFVTWAPFESYHDYWGRYTVDPSTGSITFRLEGGNYLPPDLDLSGSLTLDGDELVLRDLWLGRWSRGEAVTRCGHRFRRGM
jgi:hypothetical protein